MVQAKTSRKGFSLIETLVASAILSGAVLTIGAISTMSLSGTRVNRRYETALSLIDKQLSLIDYVGIDEFVELGQMEGDFEEIEPVYHWEVVTEYQDIDSLYLVTITVSWVDGRRPYSLSVDTMLNGISVYIEVEISLE
ncbi:MAG: prepilin-type N-terminal cleavage/methylation domain-containing protein [Planctomycetes bacterium]|nr:prepilin-type N-terminal cleavage/methylation domain-containing protein [Planctomycetota bacterium]